MSGFEAGQHVEKALFIFEAASKRSQSLRRTRLRFGDGIHRAGIVGSPPRFVQGETGMPVQGSRFRVQGSVFARIGVQSRLEGAKSASRKRKPPEGSAAGVA